MALHQFGMLESPAKVLHQGILAAGDPADTITIGGGHRRIPSYAARQAEATSTGKTTGNYELRDRLRPWPQSDMLVCAVSALSREGRLHAEIIKINSTEPEPSLIAYAAEKIRQGEVLGMPTDTFYGLAADPLNLARG